MIWLLLACSDNNLTEITLDAIAVVQGDFDDMQTMLIRNDIGSVDVNGYIDQATWWIGDDRPVRDDPGKTVEGLLTGVDEIDSEWEIKNYNAVFMSSGTRGLNAFRYSDPTETDDALLIDPDAIPNLCQWLEAGASFVASDWAYDVVERCWPGAIEFYGDDDNVDEAQVGKPGDVLADVPDEALAEALGTSVVNLTFNYSAFAVMESVGDGAEILLSGTVEYQPPGATAYEKLENVPLAVRFPAGRGQVVFTSFHTVVQTPAITDALLFRGVTGLVAGAGQDSVEESDE